MRLVYIFFPLIFFVFSCVQKDSSGNPDKFEIKSGIGLAYWLSQSDRHEHYDRETYITEKDIESIAEMGFDHVRLPVDEVQLWDEEGTRLNDGFRLMNSCINWCIKRNLRVVVDLHTTRSHHFNNPVRPLWTDSLEQQKFVDIWRDLSSVLRNYPNSMVAYELMNEPVAKDPEQWNQLIFKTVPAIRELEPNRTIVIGSNWYNNCHTFDDLKVPENDSNIILTFHMYEPFLLTHYQIQWGGSNIKKYSGPVHYPGNILSEEEFKQLSDSAKLIIKHWVDREFNKAELRKMMEKPIQKAKELGLPLYNGEYGVHNVVLSPDRVRWHRDILSVMQENGIRRREDIK